jgi:hypothetical protein
MTRHQRRKLARVRKEAKADIMLSRALHVLAAEKVRATLTGRKGVYRKIKLGAAEQEHLSQPKRSHRSGSLASGASRYVQGYSANGSDGERLGQGLSVPHRHRKRGMVKKVVGNVSFDTSQIRDHVAEAGEKIAAATAKAIYSQVTPNCQKASFKGPFVRTEK